VTTGGVVLAGGRSSRMGTAKAALDWHGVPLVVHVASTLRTALDGGPVVVVRAPGQGLPSLPDGIAAVEDPAEGRGPLQGVAAGLAALAGHGVDRAVVVATDQPHVAGVVARLVGAHDEQPAADAVAFEGQPLGALYRTTVAASAEARLAGDRSLRGLLAAITTRTLALDDGARRALRSLDTPEAYAEALRP
jgi:molybdenum cofactor guanylyltransferase